MSIGTAFVYSERFQEYNLSPTHPLRPIRLKLTYELLRAYGFFEKSGMAVVQGREATDDELALVHSPKYIDVVKSVSKTAEAGAKLYSFGIGPGDNPAFEGMHSASSFVVGSSITAVDLVMSGKVEHAINISGGLHHAMRDRASGFCIYNDAACAIAYASKKYGARVAYIDIDAHHGDGVQWAFYDRADILTMSLHESGFFLFPGTGFVDEIGSGEGTGYSVNIPLEPGTYDDVYIWAFKEVVLPIVRAFRPDLIVSQNGCDSHFTDPLAQLNLTTNAYEQLYSMIHELAHEVCGGRLVALGGGGYQIYHVVPRAWSLLSASLTITELGDCIPGSWQEMCYNLSHTECPSRLRDEKQTVAKFKAGSIKEKTEATVLDVKKKLFPFFGL
ncbi:MAG: acetoin utilization protein AcuC [Actinomycetota bacterium]|nr:acetoin utilization protein AcuC [Actinomycetota bacterium]